MRSTWQHCWLLWVIPHYSEATVPLCPRHHKYWIFFTSVGKVGLNFGNMWAFYISSDNLALEPDPGLFYGICPSNISPSPHICETINIYLKILPYFHILFVMWTPPSLYNSAQHTAQRTPPHSWISESAIHTNRTFVWLQNVGAKWIYCTGLMNTTATVQPLFLYWENCFSR